MPSLIRPFLAAAGALATGADSRTICANATGTDRGGYYSFWRDGGAGCMTLGEGRSYGVAWRLGSGENLVAGRGWAKGSADRVIRYRARRFEPGDNGYLALYGWSTDPLIEYYVVDDWGAFTPRGPGATLLGMVSSDGGTYRIYRTRRIDQPSIAGRATFLQYWSVRTSKRRPGTYAVITFANHVSAWRRAGLRLGSPNYQVLATEGFASSGRSDIDLAAR